MVTVKNFGETMFNLKKSIPLIFTFLLKTSLFLLFLLDFFPAFVGNTSQRLVQANNISGSCETMANKMKKFCTQNENLTKNEVENETIKNFLKTKPGAGAGELASTLELQGKQSEAALLKAKAICTDANTHCEKQCDTQITAVQREIQTCSPPYAPCHNLIPQFNQRITDLQSMKKQCNQEFQAAQGKFNFSLGEIAKLLGGVGSLLAALGHNNSGDVGGLAKPDGDEDDECKGPNADKILRCRGRPDPTNGGRPLVVGSGSKPGLGGGNPFQVSPQSEEPGGERGDGSGSQNVAGGNNNGGGGLGAFGAMDSGLAAVNGESENEALSEDDPGSYGYMGAGGAGSGSGGGGFGRNFGNFGKYSTGSSAKVGSASDIDKQLKKYSKANTRAPASVGTGGLNGPFQDNWEVVKKAYQRNSDTLLKR